MLGGAKTSPLVGGAGYPDPAVVVQPRVFPWHDNRLVYRYNVRAMLAAIRGALAGLGTSAPPLIVTGSPPSVGVLGRLAERGAVYLCMDDFLHLPSATAEMIGPLEQRLLSARGCRRVHGEEPDAEQGAADGPDALPAPGRQLRALLIAEAGARRAGGTAAAAGGFRRRDQRLLRPRPDPRARGRDPGRLRRAGRPGVGGRFAARSPERAPARTAPLCGPARVRAGVRRRPHSLRAQRLDASGGSAQAAGVPRRRHPRRHHRHPRGAQVP